MGGDASFIDSLKDMRIGGRYVVDKVLGAGGMGVVASARYPELGQKVAIKFLLPVHASDDVISARFVREARLAARVKSEHFVRVFDIGKLHNGVPYLVMELLSGRDLGDELDARKTLSVEQAVDYVLQASVGIAEIHALGVVHRDLKPSNLFLAEAAGKQLLKVLDFGISKENVENASRQLTSTDNLLGTPQYMSPEQVKASKDVDARSDIWSVGVILYELLCGTRPFFSDENAVGEIFAKVLYTDPRPLRELRPELPEELEAVVLRCLARDRAARFADVGELAEALRPFASPASAVRIDAVKQALTSHHSMVPPADDGGDVPMSALPTAASHDIALAPTSASDPRAGLAAAAAAAAVDGTVAWRHSDKPSAPVTAMTSSRSADTSEGKRRSRVLLLGLVGLAAVGGIGAFVVTSRSTPAPSGAGLSAVVAPPSASTTAEPPAAKDAKDAREAVPTASAAPVASVSASAAPAQSAAARVTPPVTARPRPTAPSTPTTKSTGTSSSDLILDRK